MRLALATASLRRHATRTLLAMLGVAVSAAMLLDMVMLSGGMHESFRSLLLSRGFQLRLAPKGTLPFDTDATIAGATEILRVLRQHPDVVRVSPVLGASLYVVRGSTSSGAASNVVSNAVSNTSITGVALGVDPSQQGDYEVIGGRDILTPTSMVMSDELLAAAAARVGDTVTVAAGYDPTTRALVGARRLVIAGRARFLYTSPGQRAAALPLATLQAMSDRADRVSLVMVRARAGADVEQLRRWIAARLPRVTVVSTTTALAQVDQRLSYFRQLAFILGSVSLTVGFLLVTTLMTVSVNERVGEISVMRAIGVSTGHVVQQIVLEGVVISTGGTLLGLALGVATARYLNTILSDFPGLPRAIQFFLFQPADAWTALGLLTVVGVLAGIYPAWRAASLPIATTLRQEAVA